MDKITDDFPKLMEAIESARYAHSDGMGAYMCFMAVRLLEMKRILREDGSIYLHCDPTASHYLKAIMDAIFGYRNFRNEVVWQRDAAIRGAKQHSKQWPKIYDVLLFYSKGKEWKFQHATKPLDDDQTKRYRHVDDDGRRYRTSHLGDYSEKSINNLRERGLIHTSRTGKESKKYYLDEAKSVMGNLWTDIKGFGIRSASKEKTGYPTQKPIALYERIIKASSNENDLVLDPFCGCATTLVAAERLKRQWIGIDIWDKAHETVIRRLQDEGLAAPDGDKGGRLFTVGKIAYSKDPPVRTDDGMEAVPFLKTKLQVDEPKGEKRTRAEMLEFLLDQNGSRCQGCDREFDDPRYLELDHNTPRSDGGLNHISNRILLCGPCNKLKSNRFTLSGLRRENAKLGYMAGR